MSVLWRRAEQLIREAMERGEFDDLPLAGQRLRFESSGQVPDELRLGYKILKDSGFLPPELELKKEILTLKDLLSAVTDDDERYRLARQINDRVLQLNLMHKRSFAHEDRQVYASKLRNKMLKST